MPNDLAVIKELEKTIGKKLEKISLDDIHGSARNFALDDGGRVTGLNLVNCKLTDISTLQSLTQLKRLSLGINRLTDISALQVLTQLETLYLDGNQLTDISALQSLTQLKVLYLDKNQLTDISTLQVLTQLNELDLENNKITRLPGFITQWDMKITWEKDSAGSGLHLWGNPLETPPVEIVQRGMKAVRNYFEELETAQTLLLQAKLLIVGGGEVGKTTLMRTLTEPDFQLTKDDIGKEESTHGIHIKPWAVTCPLHDDTEPSRDLTLHTWDFGGQDIYLSTHQFFLTKRSLYVFVWEARKDEESRSFDYWLNIIKLLSDNSPVMVVMNKADVRSKPIDEAAYMDKFNVKKFLRVSCLDRTGIDELTRKIHECLGRMPHLKDKLPKTWLDIREKLKAEKKDYIDADRYYEICSGFGLDRERADFLSDYLHDLGVILRFRTDPLLKNTLVLNPEWATGAVYKLIDTKKILDNKGRFQFNDLETIWDGKKYPADKHLQLIGLMEKFELCFNLAGTATYIVPELVPGQRPGIETPYFEAKDTLRFQYRYDFMPEGIVSRFIARNYHLIQGENFWRNGVELIFDGATALIIGDPPRRKLNVWVRGARQTELLAVIRNDLNHIHATLNMKKEQEHYKEEVPCRCSVCRTSEKPHLFPFTALRIVADRGKTLLCLKSYEDMQPEELLRGYAPAEPKPALLESLLTHTSQLQGKALAIRPDENSRTGFVAQLLQARGFRVQEQVPWGRSPSKKNPGELDIKIDGDNGETISVVEAFNLSGMNRRVISCHVEKIFDYDPHGLPENFMLVYVDVEDEKFAKLWDDYRAHLTKVDYPFAKKGGVTPVDTKKADIKCAYTLHRRSKAETRLYHLFIKMKKAVPKVS